MSESEAVRGGPSPPPWAKRDDFTEDCESVLKAEREWVQLRRLWEEARAAQEKAEELQLKLDAVMEKPRGDVELKTTEAGLSKESGSLAEEPDKLKLQRDELREKLKTAKENAKLAEDKAKAAANRDTAGDKETGGSAANRDDDKGHADSTDNGGGAKNSALDPIGLALSGGGVRSATFNLGLLQSMERAGVLSQVDYMSTVSGGGYIGSCLTWFKSRQGMFPFGTEREDHAGPARSVLAWLREHGSPMTPGGGYNGWAFGAAILTGTLVNLAIIVPLFLVVFFWLGQSLPDDSWRLLDFVRWNLERDAASSGFAIARLFGLVATAVFVIVVAFTVAVSRLERVRDTLASGGGIRKFSGILLVVAFTALVVGTIPQVHAIVTTWLAQASSAISLSGVLAMAGALFKRPEGGESRGGRSLLLSLGLAVFCYGIFLWFHHIIQQSNAGGGSYAWLRWWPLASFVLALLASINHVSMHWYYRNRLKEAYLPHDIQWEPGSGWEDEPKFRGWNNGYATKSDADKFWLWRLQKPTTDAPYHILNTVACVPGSDSPELQGRPWLNFIFSPLYYGSEKTGFLSTASFEGRSMDLATALAVSGAAVDPNVRATRSKPLSFLMALLNFRVGYWLRNPQDTMAAEHSKWLVRVNRFLGGKPSASMDATAAMEAGVPARVSCFLKLRGCVDWYRLMFREMTGIGMHEKARDIRLTDGGCFDNLGVYELIRRRCKYIIVSDAGADKEWTFDDLGRVIQLARLDFGADIQIDTSGMWPDEDDPLKRSPQVYAVGHIRYTPKPVSGGKGKQKDEEGMLLFIKTGLFEGLTSDIYSYRRKNSDYPDQKTADQFYDERQFEAYRELGFRTGWMIFGEDCQSIEDLFQSLRRREGTRLAYDVAPRRQRGAPKRRAAHRR